MKKKSFLSGVNAKLALAAVALTSVMFTSCEKEEFNVAPVELDPASATIAVTVYDLGDRSIITEGLNITGDTEVRLVLMVKLHLKQESLLLQKKIIYQAKDRL